MVVGSQRNPSAPLPPEKDQGIHCTEGRVGVGLSTAMVKSANIIY